MFSLFRRSRLVPGLHKLTVLVAWLMVAYWLKFTFVDKAFLDTLFSGSALFVDLLLGLPVVLIFAVVLYALVYWLVKMVTLLLFPNWVVIDDEPLEDDETYEMEHDDDHTERQSTEISQSGLDSDPNSVSSSVSEAPVSASSKSFKAASNLEK